MCCISLHEGSVESNTGTHTMLIARWFQASVVRRMLKHGHDGACRPSVEWLPPPCCSSAVCHWCGGAATCWGCGPRWRPGRLGWLTWRWSWQQAWGRRYWRRHQQLRVLVSARSSCCRCAGQKGAPLPVPDSSITMQDCTSSSHQVKKTRVQSTMRQQMCMCIRCSHA